jgi:3-hydroxyisobutyrate dehydrogenase
MNAPESTARLQVAVLGAGIMGAGMARSIARAGHDVRLWNRTPEKARAAEQDGITAHDDLASAVSGADVVVTMLFDAEALLDVAPDVVAAMEPSATWVQASTVGPQGMSRLSEAVGEVVDRLLDAPVLGTRQPAEDGKLVVLVSGPAAARDAAGPVLDAVGSRVVDAGSELGAASALKLACNSWVATVTAGVAQALALASALGVPPESFLDAIKGGPLDAPYVQLKGGLMIEQAWVPPSFPVDGVRKDLGLMLESVQDTEVSPELLRTLLDYYDRTSSDGDGGADMAAVRRAFGD